ncbi:MAG: lmo0937 family membrane protein [Rhodopirellula sp.]|nr:lmo0937 family membrane protein [Rhodopirellula sp.]
MLWTIAVILLFLWMFGFMFSVAGHFVHMLLVIAAIVVVVQVLQGRKGLT